MSEFERQTIHHTHAVLAIEIDVQQRVMSGFSDRTDINVTPFWQLLKALIQADAAFDGKQVAAMHFCLP